MKRVLATTALAALITGCADEAGSEDAVEDLTPAKAAAITESASKRDVHLPARQLEKYFGYILEPPSGQPAITKVDAIEAAGVEDAASHAQLRAAAVRSVYSPDIGRLVHPGDPNSAVIPKYNHEDEWVLAFDAMMPRLGVSQPQAPGGNEPNPLVPATVVVIVDARTGEALGSSMW